MSVYRVIDVIGTSTTSWEEAAADAIREAGTSVRDLRVAEIVKQDIHVGDGGQLHLPHEDPTVLQVRAASQASARLIARAPSAVIIAAPKPNHSAWSLTDDHLSLRNVRE
jgi:dodecin